MQANNGAGGDPADVQLLKEWNIDRFFSRDDEKRHSTQSAIVASASAKELAHPGRLLERQVHREIIAPRPKPSAGPAAPLKNSIGGSDREKFTSPVVVQPAATETGGNFMKNFSFIKNFKREKSDLFPMSKRHSSEISYNVNVNKYISAPPPANNGVAQRSSVVERSGATAAAKKPDHLPSGASLLRAGPRREKTESVILRRNSTQVTAKQAEDARVRASIVSRTGGVAEGGATGQSPINNPNIDLKSNVVAGEGGSRFYGDQVIYFIIIVVSVDPGIRKEREYVHWTLLISGSTWNNQSLCII